MNVHTAASRRAWLCRAAAGLAGLVGLATWPTVGLPAGAAWPTRPLRILVAYPPGGISDGVARVLAQQLSGPLGTPVLVENRPGAGGALAIEGLARSAADGHTLAFAAITALALANHGNNTRVPVLPVAGVMTTPVLLVGTPALQGNSFAQMLVQARTQPGGLRWATTGAGTTGHQVLQQVQRLSGITITHVPYKGGAQQVNDALGGQFELLSTNVAHQQLEAIRSGRLKALAVGAPSRLPALPEVPTLAELGFAQANLVSLFGLFAPPGTPPAIVARLNAEVNQALAQPLLQAHLLAMNNLPVHGSAEDFAQQIGQLMGR